VTVYMTGSRASVPLVKNADINVITGLLKIYLRELPEALFTDALYPKLVEGFGEYCWLEFRRIVTWLCSGIIS